MSKIKLLLDVVEDLRSLADSVQAVADAMLRNEDPDADAPAAPKPQEPPKPTAAPKKESTLEQVRAVLAEKSHDGLSPLGELHLGTEKEVRRWKGHSSVCAVPRLRPRPRRESCAE